MERMLFMYCARSPLYATTGRIFSGFARKTLRVIRIDLQYTIPTCDPIFNCDYCCALGRSSAPAKSRSRNRNSARVRNDDKRRPSLCAGKPKIVIGVRYRCDAFAHTMDDGGEENNKIGRQTESIGRLTMRERRSDRDGNNRDSRVWGVAL